MVWISIVPAILILQYWRASAHIIVIVEGNSTYENQKIGGALCLFFINVMDENHSIC